MSALYAHKTKVSSFILTFFSWGVGAWVWVGGCGRLGVGRRDAGWGGLRMGRAEDGGGLDKDGRRRIAWCSPPWSPNFAVGMPARV